VRLDIPRGRIEPSGGGAQLQGAPLPEFVLDILAQGGLLPKLAADGYLPTASV
jgi:3-isopropylmalate/(R)-2-methylmalate dehydratase small subunit